MMPSQLDYYEDWDDPLVPKRQPMDWGEGTGEQPPHQEDDDDWRLYGPEAYWRTEVPWFVFLLVLYLVRVCVFRLLVN